MMQQGLVKKTNETYKNLEGLLGSNIIQQLATPEIRESPNWYVNTKKPN